MGLERANEILTEGFKVLHLSRKLNSSWRPFANIVHVMVISQVPAIEYDEFCGRLCKQEMQGMKYGSQLDQMDGTKYASQLNQGEVYAAVARGQPPRLQSSSNHQRSRQGQVQEEHTDRKISLCACYHCQRPGHMARGCENTPFCGVCQKERHSSRDCGKQTQACNTEQLEKASAEVKTEDIDATVTGAMAHMSLGATYLGCW